MDRPAPPAVSRITLSIIGLAAGAVALYMAASAILPFLIAEPGSARYAREHTGEATLQVLASAALLWVSFASLRRARTLRSVAIIGVVLVAFFSVRSFTAGYKPPPNLQPVGGAWHAVRVPQPREADSVYFDLYYQRGGRYERIEDLVAEYRFVPPDCLLFRGLKVVGSPRYAMCGYRAPVETYDTLADESTLLRQARTRPSFRRDWRVDR